MNNHFNQLDLLETETRPIEYMKAGMLHRNHGTWEERNFHGFRQSRYKGDSWVFQIRGFCGPQLEDGSDGIGNVILFDGGYESCQMDMKNRVRIDGTWYNHSHWDH